MTQNNEREALLDKLLAEYWDIAYSEGNSGLWHGKKAQSTLNDIRKLFKTQSPISQNEQQEAVAFMDEDGEIYALPEQKLLNISIDDLIKSIGKNGVRLYTSRPKQIPDGWISTKDRLPDQLELKIKLIDGSEIYAWYQSDGDYYWNCGGREIFIDELKVTHWMPLPEAPTTSETNMGVGE